MRVIGYYSIYGTISKYNCTRKDSESYVLLSLSNSSSVRACTDLIKACDAATLTVLDTMFSLCFEHTKPDAEVNVERSELFKPLSLYVIKDVVGMLRSG